jgi:hypothetical protein
MEAWCGLWQPSSFLETTCPSHLDVHSRRCHVVTNMTEAMSAQ